MLVKRTSMSKKTVILLVVFGVIVIVGGYFVYTNFIGSSSSSESIPSAAPLAESREVIPKFDDGLFRDSQYLSFQRDKFSGFTNQPSGMALDSDVPLPPISTVVVNPATGKRLVVTWELPKEHNFATSKLYRSQLLGEIGDVIATLNITADQTMATYEDTNLSNDQRYFYLVRTVNESGQESQNSAQEVGVPTDTTPPDPPSQVAVAQKDGTQLEVSWTNPTDVDFQSIRIYRSIRKGQVGEVISENSTGTATPGNENRRFYLDTTVDPNVPYYYTVTSVDGNGNESTKDILAAPVNYNPFEPIQL